MRRSLILLLALVAIILPNSVHSSVCGDGILDPSEECDDASDLCCISCKVKVCMTNEPCFNTQGSCSAKTGECSFIPRNDGELCSAGNCIGACLKGQCITIGSCEYNPEIQVLVISNVQPKGDDRGTKLLRVMETFFSERRDRFDFGHIAFSSTGRAFIVPEANRYKFESEHISENEPGLESISEGALLASQMTNAARSRKFAFFLGNFDFKGMPTVFAQASSDLEKLRSAGFKLSLISDLPFESIPSDLPFEHAHILSDMVLDEYWLEAEMKQMETSISQKRSYFSDGGSSSCLCDSDCIELDNECNSGRCRDGKCRRKSDVYDNSGSRRHCSSSKNKCAVESRCYEVNGTGVCKAKRFRDCSCYDNIDTCEEGYCNPKNGRCEVKHGKCGSGSCSINPECDPKNPCCDAATCKWRPVESRCAKKAGHFDKLSQAERLCVNNYCNEKHECVIFPIKEGAKCFDLRENHKCSHGKCVSV